MEEKDKELRAALLDIKKLERRLAPKKPPPMPPPQAAAAAAAAPPPPQGPATSPSTDPSQPPPQGGDHAAVHVVILVVKEGVSSPEMGRLYSVLTSLPLDKVKRGVVYIKIELQHIEIDTRTNFTIHIYPSGCSVR